MHIFQIRLQKAMQDSGKRATDLARETGLSKARISQYVNGRYIPKSDAQILLAAALGVSPLWLMGEDVPQAPESGKATAHHAPAAYPVSPLDFPLPSNVSPVELRRYPVVGEIACGQPILAEEDHDGGYIRALDTNADFCLTVKGDSMINARIWDGDKVLIRRTEMVRNGEIAAVVVDDDEATLKRVYYHPDEGKLILVPENPDYKPLVFVGEELNHIHILGQAVAFQARIF